MRWASETRETLSQLQEPDAAPTDPKLRVLVAAMVRADQEVAAVIVRAMSRSRGQGPATIGQIPTMKQLLILPVGDRCNLACGYCYESGRREERMLDSRLMPVETVQAVLDNVLPFVGRPFSVAMHGGEPLLAGREFFRRVGDVIRRYPESDGVRLAVQTNATLIDARWAALLRDYSYGVGVSVDGPPDVHDMARVTARGSGTYEKTLRGINALRAEGVSFGAISVISGAHARRPRAPADLLAHFRELAITSFDVHPAFSHALHTSVLNVSPQAYAEFMIELFEEWLAAGDERVSIGLFDHVLEGMTGHGPFVCYLSGGCVSVLGVAADGQAVPCTRPFDPKYRFGSLATHPLPDVLRSPVFQTFSREEVDGRQKTVDCEWAALCGGGCPHERSSDGRQAVDGRNAFCTCHGSGLGGYPAIFEHIVRRVHELLRSAPVH